MTTEIKNAAIQQINIAYNAIEDRLLLKIGFSGDAELAVWLTRRLVKGLWQLLQTDELPSLETSRTSDPEATQPVTKDHNRAVQALDFSADYKPRQTVNQGEVLLARDCHILKSASETTALELTCTNGQTVKLALTQELSVALVSMLQLVSKETGWELPLAMPVPMMAGIQTSTALH